MLKKVPFLLFALAGFIICGCGTKPQEAAPVADIIVETIKPSAAEFRESFTEQAVTRLSKTYTVTMPMEGRIGRIELELGSAVKAGQKIATLDRAPLELAVAEIGATVAELESAIELSRHKKLEESVLASWRKAIANAEQALKAADAQVAAEKTLYDRYAKQVKNNLDLVHTSVLPPGKLEESEMNANSALIELRKREFSRAILAAIYEAYKLVPEIMEDRMEHKSLETAVLTKKLEQAKARLAQAQNKLKYVEILSPADGIVLEIFKHGDGYLPAGSALFVIGNLNDLEGEAEILTSLVPRIGVGTEVVIDVPSYPKPINGKVIRIEPVGFQKASPSGAVEQRVKVIFSLETKPDGLGVQYGITAHFHTGSRASAFAIPTKAIYREPNGAAFVYAVRNNALAKQSVQIHHAEGDKTFVNGVTAGDLLALELPGVVFQDGMKVKIKK